VRLTGDPNRQVKLGYEKSAGFPERRFAFDAFKFPSCRACNEIFGQLEERAKGIIEAILQLHGLSSVDLNDLLDWFDKIRVGLWLAHYYLDKNAFGFSRNFEIEARLAAHDRLLGVYRCQESPRGLTFIGTETPSFYMTPSCFALVVNGFHFLNISYPYLFSRRLGFPYVANAFLLANSKGFSGEFNKGRQRVMLPLLKGHSLPKGAHVFQPMFKYQMGQENLKELYDNEYVRAHSTVWDEGRGQVFMESDGALLSYPESISTKWVPKDDHPYKKLRDLIVMQVLRYQVEINQQAPSSERLSPQERKDFKKRITAATNANKRGIQRMTKNMVS